MGSRESCPLDVAEGDVVSLSAQRLGVQLQIPVRARRAACMAGRSRRDGCRRHRASFPSCCFDCAGAPIGACQPS